MASHYRVTLGDATAAHERALKGSGGRQGMIDKGLLKSALFRPYSGYYRSIHTKAAALIHAVATNHAFVDGNKRTAFVLFHLPIERSGYEIRKVSTGPEDDIEHLILDLTTRFLTQHEAACWLKTRLQNIK